MATTNRTGGNRGYAASDSRRRAQSRSQGRTGTGSGRRTAPARSTAGSRGSSGRSSGAPYRSYSSRRRKPSPDYRLIAIIGLILILVIAAVAFGMRNGRFQIDEPETESSTAAETETDLQQEVTVDGVSITGMSREQAKEELLKKYPWAMTAVCQGDVYEIPNLMGDKIDALLGEIYSGTGSGRAIYSMDTGGLEEAIEAQAAAMAEKWNKAARNGSIAGYDSASDSFTFAGEETGLEIDQEKLKADIQAALSARDFDRTIEVTANAVQPEISQANAQNLYKTLGSYTTNTTSNSKRNTNVKLAAQKLNGTILQPGEELSFNNTVGERTEAKGYQSAAAYNNGEVVQEIGGGVCQVSTTLYNAVVKSGLQVSKRQSHTFEPSYVTPGQDATVSWGGPDFRFINNSKSAIGIKASYYNQTVTVSIYGIPVLEDGVSQYLESVKLKDIDPPAPTYEEDQTLQPGEEVVVSAGSSGSQWQTKLIVKKNGEIISSNVDHTVTYKGHNPVIKRNTSGIVIGGETQASDQSGEETTAQETVQVGPGEWAPANPDVSSGPGQATQNTAPAPAADSSAGPGGAGSAVPGPVEAPQTEIPAGPGMSSSDGGVVAPPIP